MSFAPSHPASFWQAIADVYSEASEDGRSTTAAVKEHLASLGIETTSNAVACHWVMQARRRGFIPPTKKGASAWHSARLRAVAEEIGVEAELLADAIITHAAGRLTIRRKTP